jgi:VCBS repeat-containing protein
MSLLGIMLSADDADGDTLTYSIVAQPQHGTLSGAAPNLTYTPNANYSGEDFFTFQANDGALDSNLATVSISISAKNDAPVAQNGTVTTNEDQTKSITLTASDAESDALAYSIVTLPQHGTLSGSGANRTYTPNANYNGSDSFTFKTTDGTTESNTATVSVTVTPVNDAPSFTLSGTALQVKKNASIQTYAGWAKSINVGPADESGQTPTFIVTNNNTGLFSAQPVINSNGTLTFTPAKNKSGTATVTVKLQDNGGTANGGINESVTRTFTIKIG